MIIGTGQLAKVFAGYIDENVCLFASGVSDSSCVDSTAFDREKSLLLSTLRTYPAKRFIYFSSCALSAADYEKNAYYNHKADMEDLVAKHANHHFIFRIPQFFGDLIHHKTLINFIYESIQGGLEFNVYNDAHRYVIEAEDVRKLVLLFLENSNENLTIDLANPYRYPVTEIVETFERLLNKEAYCNIVTRTDKYTLDLTDLMSFLNRLNVDMGFGVDYLRQKLLQKIK